MFSIEYLHKLRDEEISVIVRRFPPGARVLELGAGTGQQAAKLAALGFEVSAIDLESSNYAEAEHAFPVQLYDGRTIPFSDATFDIVFSSNVLEHVRDLAPLHAEIRRVLKPAGKCVHVLPTDAWRFWTTLSAFPAGAQYLASVPQQELPPRVRGNPAKTAYVMGLRFLAAVTFPVRQRRHGERGNVLTEQYYFRPSWWRRHFLQNGFSITYEAPMGLFYTGHTVLPSLSFERRRALAKSLGSACHLFELRPA